MRKARSRILFLLGAMLGSRIAEAAENPYAGDLGYAWERYRGALTDQLTEEQKLAELRRPAGPKPMAAAADKDSEAAPQSVAQFSRLDLSQRVEWSLRLGGGARAPLPDSGDALLALRDENLLDAGLWEWLRVGVPNFFAPTVRWPEERERFTALLARLSPERRAKLNLAPHGEWWRWLGGQQKESDESNEESNDPLLRATRSAAWAGAQTSLAPAVSLYLEALGEVWGRAELTVDMEALERAGFARMRKIAGDTREVARAVMQSELRDSQWAKIEWMRFIAQSWRDLARPALAADAMAYHRELLKLPADQNLRIRLLVQAAALNRRAGRYALAAQNLRELLTLKLDTDVALRARADLALTTEQWALYADRVGRRPDAQNLWEWAAEYFRRASETALVGETRDEVLAGYARALERLGFWQASLDVRDVLFRVGRQSEVQLRAQRESLELTQRKLREDMGRGNIDMPLRERYQSFVQLLSLTARAQPQIPQLGAALRDARAWVGPLKMRGDAELSATLNEVSAAIEHADLRSGERALKNSNKKAGAR